METNKNAQTQLEWDIYWSGKGKKGNVIYDAIAQFYRRKVITKALTHFIFKHFKKGQQLLHAGCGSGQVDEIIADNMHITALDISPNALKIYTDIHKDKCKVVQGTIFSLPFPDETFDGVYNLGVMEHFTEDEIQQILTEFMRVLKVNGKMVIFWPPEFGLSVFVLDRAHFILNKILRLNIKLHPEEITRLQSKQHAVSIFKKAGFKILEYYFGARDIFIQSVIVVEKHKV